MSNEIKVEFEVNTFDKDGDLIEEGIYLHFNSCRIRVAGSMDEYYSLVSHLERMGAEISELIED